MNLWMSQWNRSNTTSPGVSLFGIPQCHHRPGFCNNFITVVRKLNLLKWEWFFLMVHSKRFAHCFTEVALWSYKMSGDISLAKQAMKHKIKTTWDYILEYLNTAKTVPIHGCYCVWSWGLNLLMENKVWRFYFPIDSLIHAWSIFWARYY